MNKKLLNRFSVLKGDDKKGEKIPALNIKGLTKTQNKMVNDSFSYSYNSQLKAIYTFCLGSVIIQTNNDKYYAMSPDGEIRNASYYDLIAFDYEKLWTA